MAKKAWSLHYITPLRSSLQTHICIGEGKEKHSMKNQTFQAYLEAKNLLAQDYSIGYQD